ARGHCRRGDRRRHLHARRGRGRAQGHGRRRDARRGLHCGGGSRRARASRRGRHRSRNLHHRGGGGRVAAGGRAARQPHREADVAFHRAGRHEVEHARRRRRGQLLVGGGQMDEADLVQVRARRFGVAGRRGDRLPGASAVCGGETDLDAVRRRRGDRGGGDAGAGTRSARRPHGGEFGVLDADEDRHTGRAGKTGQAVRQRVGGGLAGAGLLDEEFAAGEVFGAGLGGEQGPAVRVADVGGFAHVLELGQDEDVAFGGACGAVDGVGGVVEIRRRGVGAVGGRVSARRGGGSGGGRGARGGGDRLRCGGGRSFGLNDGRGDARQRLHHARGGGGAGRRRAGGDAERDTHGNVQRPGRGERLRTRRGGGRQFAGGGGRGRVVGRLDVGQFVQPGGRGPAAGFRAERHTAREPQLQAVGGGRGDAGRGHGQTRLAARDLDGRLVSGRAGDRHDEDGAVRVVGLLERPRGGFVAVRDLPVQAGLELVFACRVLVEDLPVAAYRHVGQGAQVAHVEGDQKVPGLEVGGGGDQGGEPVGGLGDVPDFGVDAGGGHARLRDGSGRGDRGRAGRRAEVGGDGGRRDGRRRLHRAGGSGGVHAGHGGRHEHREAQPGHDRPGGEVVLVARRRRRREHLVHALGVRERLVPQVGELGVRRGRGERAVAAVAVSAREPDFQTARRRRRDRRAGDVVARPRTDRRVHARQGGVLHSDEDRHRRRAVIRQTVGGRLRPGSLNEHPAARVVLARVLGGGQRPPGRSTDIGGVARVREHR